MEDQLVWWAFFDFLCIEGLKDYVKVCQVGETRFRLFLSSLRLLKERLFSQQFTRVHRSCIVGLNHITAVTRSTVHSSPNVTIPVSDGHREQFDQFCNCWK